MRFLATLVFLFIVFNAYAVSFFNEKNKASTTIQAEKEFQDVLNFAEQLRDSSFNESIKIGKQAVSLAKSTNTPNILGLSYKSLATTYFYQGVFDSSYYYYQKAFGEYAKIEDTLSLGKITSNIGVIYRRTGKYDKALKQYLKAIKIYESLNNKKGLSSVYFNIGGVYQTLGNTDKALQFYLLAERMFEEMSDNKRLSRVLTNIGVIKYEQELYDESLKYQLKALELNEKAGMIQHKAIILLNIGQSYQALNDLEKAIDYFTQCETLRIQLDDRWGLGKIYMLKAVSYKIMKQYSKANKYFLLAEESTKENKLAEDLKETYFHYASYWDERNKPQKAINYLKKYYYLKDSLNGIYQQEIVAELKTKYESEQKEKELELLQQKSQIQKLELDNKNAWIIALLVVLILGVVAIVVSLRINRLRVDHKIMDLRQKVLLTQMNPHFLFNSLTAIQSFILDEKNDDANNYLSRLASLVRGILENSREEFVSLRTELHTLEDYIGLQKLRFENDIAYHFEVDENIDQDQILVPPMLAQPFVENALIHGKLRSNPDAEIRVKISLADNKELLQFQIQDNGIGIEESKKICVQKNHKSLATSIALDRVKIYNFKSSKKMNFEILDLKQINPDQNGTLVSYSIPVNYLLN